MMRYILTVALSLVVFSILVALGLWQLERLEWKENMLSELRARIDTPADNLPQKIDPALKYRPVLLRGTTTGQEIDVISYMDGYGAGYQVISAFVTDDGRKIMVDRGFVSQDMRRMPRPPVGLEVYGHLHWPQDASSATPKNDLENNIWFSRDVTQMAAHLDTLPVLVVAAKVSGDNQGVIARPLTIEGVPNNHLSYAVQWFLMAAVWAVMSGVVLWNMFRRKNKGE